ncbi:SSU ribosomal protein S12P methylthiotransferase [Humidesulfovibrio mexicanus]|uniref:Ribosomal protein uS12 methylthiotransferase RimO n=1 Tax=Humidesulfovibrio mexicanus TaxID=147047 RepID=A0A238Y9T4_9BACT|nr:30S ribosomal protein S12 methylthiotransferase RimO [Humidesulfovibrio mexicanus]SNR67578.1 SSU ribosomal protein S12P methylthiotransferase [Humidesulfovibrio mexicanus]
MQPIRVHTVSLGCPKNRVDTECLLGVLGEGLVPAEGVADADLVLVNTCGFIRPAVEESVNTILSAIQEAGDAPKRPLLAVAGCLVSRYGRAALAADLPEVDLWLSTREMDQWPERIGAALGRKRLETLGPRRLSTGPAYAYLKISEGCSHRCAFCTIPAIRGRHVSRGLDDLEREARLLVEEGGVPELVVVGQDVTSYGRDLDMTDGLARLLDRLMPIKGLKWLRLMYLYPAGLTDGLLKHMAGLGRPFLPYFDIPLQHAHPEILSAMGRPFAQDPSLVVDRVRRHFPDAALRTSLIVGFPGETDRHYAALRDFVARTRFANLGVFPYHQEEGTRAAELPGQVAQGTKTRRRNALMKLQESISRERLDAFVGSRQEVLVEDESPEWPGLHVGRVWFQAPEVDGVTYVSGPKVKPGRLLLADIEQAQSYDLVALA